jgi:hypothetical protein
MGFTSKGNAMAAPNECRVYYWSWYQDPSDGQVYYEDETTVLSPDNAQDCLNLAREISCSYHQWIDVRFGDIDTGFEPEYDCN